MKTDVPVQLVGLLENMMSDCNSCVKWENIHSDFFTVMFGVRQGSVLAPFLFAVFLDELSDTCNLDRNRFVVVYADDILLISPTVVNLENLIHLCERELNWLDVATRNFLKANLGSARIFMSKDPCVYKLLYLCNSTSYRCIYLNDFTVYFRNMIQYIQ